MSISKRARSVANAIEALMRSVHEAKSREDLDDSHAVLVEALEHFADAISIDAYEAATGADEDEDEEGED